MFAKYAKAVECCLKYAELHMPAGIMSLPHAMAVLGLAFGTFLLMVIYWLAYYTLKKLVKYVHPFAGLPAGLT